MRLLAAFIVTLLTASLPFAASAQEEPEEDEFSRSGPYVGIGATYGNYVQSESAVRAPADDLGFVGQLEGPDDAIGGEFYLGYRMSEYLGVEAQVEYFSPTRIELAGNDVLELSGYSATMSAKLFPIGGRLQPFAALGAGALILAAEDKVGLGFDQHNESLVIRIGGGLDYYLTRIFALNLGVDYLVPIGDDLDNADVLSISLGVMARF